MIRIVDPTLRAWSNISNNDLWAGCKEAAKYVTPLIATHGWADQVFEKALLINRPWVLENRPTASFEGFARILRLNDAVRSTEFDTSSDLFDTELGEYNTADTASAPTTRDLIAVGRGFSEELISFAENSFDDVISAGFSIRLTRSPVVRTSNGEDVIYETETHRSLLVETEIRLRELIVCKFHSKHGENWLDNVVSRNKSRAWKKRLSEDEYLGRPTFDIIHYADFWDLHDLVVDPRNWSLFMSTFKQQADFTASMSRLKPIRHSIAHARPIGKADIITIISETARLMSAMGFNILMDD